MEKCNAVGRAAYLKAWFEIVIPSAWGLYLGIAVLIEAISEPWAVFPFALLVFASVLALRLVFGRLHDLGLSRWLVLFFLAPAVNVAFMAFLLFWRGGKCEHKEREAK